MKPAINTVRFFVDGSLANLKVAVTVDLGLRAGD
jgi:hypothetical protein